MESVSDKMKRIQSIIGEKKYLSIYNDAMEDINNRKLLSQNPYDKNSTEYECYDFHYKFLASWFNSNCVSDDCKSKRFIRFRYGESNNDLLNTYNLNFNKILKHDEIDLL
jgi:hypothetical protein